MATSMVDSFNCSEAFPYKWKLRKKQGVLPPSVAASHYTSKEPFPLSRHPINHRVVFHHQLLVASTLVFSALTCGIGDGDAGEARGVLQARASAPGPSCEAFPWVLQVLLLSARARALACICTAVQTLHGPSRLLAVLPDSLTVPTCLPVVLEALCLPCPVPDRFVRFGSWE